MRLVKSALVAMFALIAATNAAAQHNQGPPVGATLPAISAQDQSGAQRDLTSLMGQNGLVLLVTRAADWCPYCQRQMIGLEGVRAQIEQRGWKLAVITTDSVAELAGFDHARNIGYAMLSDEDFRIVRALGLTDPAFPPGSRRHGIPVPTIFFVSPQGRVLARLGDADFRVRPASETVIATIDGLR